MSALRRYEILVPLRFNDGQPVPEPLLVETFRELREQFNAASWETQILRGVWEHEGTVYHDNLTRFFVEVPDLPAHREFFRQFKEQLKVRFKQIDIRVTPHAVDVM